MPIVLRIGLSGVSEQDGKSDLRQGTSHSNITFKHVFLKHFKQRFQANLIKNIFKNILPKCAVMGNAKFYIYVTCICSGLNIKLKPNPITFLIK